MALSKARRIRLLEAELTRVFRQTTDFLRDDRYDDCPAGCPDDPKAVCNLDDTGEKTFCRDMGCMGKRFRGMAQRIREVLRATKEDT